MILIAFFACEQKDLKMISKEESSEGAGGMAGMATAIPILVDLCSKALPGTNFVFSDCPTRHQYSFAGAPLGGFFRA